MPRNRKTGQRIRKPGAPNDIDDNTLRDTTSPDVLVTLTPDQLIRRRRLRQRQAAEARKMRKEIAEKDKSVLTATSRFCISSNERGEPCEHRHIIGSDYCQWHMEAAERERLGVRDPREGAGRPRAPIVKAPELLRQIVESQAQSIISPYFEALGLELMGYDEETGQPVCREIEGGGLRLYGTSKDGDIQMSDYRDIAGMVAVAEKLLDRVYGKPKQSTTIEGGLQPIKVQPVRSEERAIEVASILAAARALPPAPAPTDVPHDGRRRRQPSTGDVIDLDERRGEDEHEHDEHE